MLARAYSGARAASSVSSSEKGVGILSHRAAITLTDHPLPMILGLGFEPNRCRSFADKGPVIVVTND